MVRLETAIGRQIRRARDAKGWTQQELADALSSRGLPMSRPTLLRLEKGPRDGGRAISVQEWLTIAAVLEVPPLLLLMPLGHVDEVEVTSELRMHPHLAVDWIVGETPPGHTAEGPGTAPYLVGNSSHYYAAAEPLRAWRELRKVQTAFAAAEVRFRSADGIVKDPLPSVTERLLDHYMREREEAWGQCVEVAPEFRDALLRIRGHGMQPPAYGRLMVNALASALGQEPDALVDALGLELLADPQED